MHLDIYRELEKGKAISEQAAFDIWREEFNTERPHEALGMAIPAEVYSPSKRIYKGTPESQDVHIPKDMIVLTQDEWNREIRVPASLSSAVIREGILLS